MNTEAIKKKAEKARILLNLTQDQADLIRGCAWQVYEDVSYDMVPDFKRSKTCRRSTIIQVVLDAGRLEQWVRRRSNLSESPHMTAFGGRGVNDEEETNPLVLACRSNFDLLKDLIGPSFLCGEYEVGSGDI